MRIFVAIVFVRSTVPSTDWPLDIKKPDMCSHTRKYGCINAENKMCMIPFWFASVNGIVAWSVNISRTEICVKHIHMQKDDWIRPVDDPLKRLLPRMTIQILASGSRRNSWLKSASCCLEIFPYYAMLAKRAVKGMRCTVYCRGCARNLINIAKHLIYYM